ncbi:Leucine-responsive regulatory protein [uncultured Ruminococcus sp.]|uniref:Lrp/AsnC family transcriptional regulator n=1 Tax=Massiliimalia timonensis TaxID=1987501 RepID=A0A8J6P8D5_9FIRM|nr:Lrp/AsnC family transcriptional regulator [Massiliimalia timonensis]MBC8611535.1 Lrp/AsnC family transcriptional regulator [Massiliimalia timonensis]MBS7175383.1 Lrp/AsnC family transcriptional regulator [Clostridiales bacterium]SCH01632.1 Leucine-responsive regulatory protein [uncultured Clostridium sp.]SCH97550.1 Leucine-responsive regulatory protein [uncultured Ruminococcus sp.]
MNQLIRLLEENSRLTNAQLAVMLGTTEEDVAQQISRYEAEGILIGYTAVVDQERLDKEYVEAYIELRVTPQRDHGFEEIATRVAAYDEVKDVYLMSGGYDLAVIVTGTNFKDIAMFVAKRLSTLDSVVSTATHFLLKRYKEHGVLIDHTELDERSV